MGKGQELIRDYVIMNDYAKAVIDHTVKNFMKANPVLLVKGRLRRKAINPEHSDLWDLPFEQMLILKRSIKDNDFFKTIQCCYDVTEKDILNLRIYNCFSSHKWIMNQLESINTVERVEFDQELTDEEIQAGVKDFERFGDSLMIDKAATLFNCAYDEVLAKDYYTVFQKLAIENAKNKYQIKYQEIVTRKAQTNS